MGTVRTSPFPSTSLRSYVFGRVYNGASLSYQGARSNLLPSTSDISSVPFTLETWIYYDPKISTISYTILGISSNGSILFDMQATGRPRFRFNPWSTPDFSGKSVTYTPYEISFISGSSLSTGWHHLAITSSSSITTSQGSVVSFYIDGIRVYQSTYAPTSTMVSRMPYHASSNPTGNKFTLNSALPICGARFVEECLSSSLSFIVPTTPFGVMNSYKGWDNDNTTVVPQKFRLTGDPNNASSDVGIYDASSYYHSIAPTGIVTTLASSTAYGSGSTNAAVEFASTNYSGNAATSPTDYLAIPYHEAYWIGNRSATLEFWINLRSLSADGVIGQGISTNGWGIDLTSAGKLRFLIGSSVYITSTANLVVGTWHYVAIVMTATTVSMYIDGAAQTLNVGTGTIVVPTEPLIIGALRKTSYAVAPSVSSTLNGSLQDIRITIGASRTVTSKPTLPFPIK
jgi:hypothetical protein